MATASQMKITRFLIWSARHFRVLLLIASLFILIAGFLALFAGNYGNDITELFSPDSESGRTFRVMQRSRLTNQVVLELAFERNGIDFSVIDQVIEKLGKLPEVLRVDSVMYRGNSVTAMDDMTYFLPQVVAVEELDKIDPVKTVSRLKKMLMQPMTPGSTFMRTDPFGWRNRSLLSLGTLNELSGLSFSPEYNYFVSRDGRHVQLMLDVSVSSADVDASLRFIGSLEQIIGSLPPGVRGTVFSAHIHSIGNAEVLRIDVMVCGVLAAVFLLILFLWLYGGELRSFWIPLIPLGASLLVLGGMAVACNQVFFFIVGLGGGTIGLAVDQGIHIYAARRGVMGLRRVGRVFGPLLFSVVTSACGFFLLGVMGITAYTQLGIFAGASLLTSLLLSFVLLPTMISGPERRDRMGLFACRVPEKYDRYVVAGYFLLLGVCVWALPELRGHLALKSFDGTPQKFLQQEQDFAERWRTGMQPAVLMVLAPDREKLARDMVALKGLFGSIPVVSPTDFVPPEAERKRSLTSWKQAVASGKWSKMEQSLRAELIRQGLPVRFFDRFFIQFKEGIGRRHEVPEVLQTIIGKMTREDAQGFSGALLFADRPEDLKVVRRFAADFAGTVAVISPTAFPQMLSDDFSGRIIRVLIAAVVAILLLTIFFFRSLEGIFFASLPLFTTLLVLGGVFAWSGMPLNFAALFAMVILVGLTIDFGVFGWCAVQRKDSDGLLGAMGLSAMTTIFATGALLFSRHPILFYTGLVLVVGVMTAYVSSIFVVPSLRRLLRGGIQNIIRGTTVVMLCVLLSGCAATDFTRGQLPELALSEAQARDEIIAWNSRMAQVHPIRSLMFMAFPGGTLPILAFGKVDQAAGVFRAVALTPTGAKLMTCDGRDEATARFDVLPFENEMRRMFVAKAFHRVLTRSFFDNRPAALDNITVGRDEVVLREKLPDGTRRIFRYGGKPLRLLEKESGSFWKTYYRVEFFDFEEDAQSGWYPGEVVCHDLKTYFRGVIRPEEKAVKEKKKP